jgi:hypothetical protein
MREERVAPGLGEHALARVDQDHRAIGGRRAGDHVAGILFVARGIGDDELALLGSEEAIGDVDGDALLALGGEAVDQQGKIDVLPLRAKPAAVRLERGELVLEDRLGIVKQATDQRRLAVVDRAAGDEAQHRLVGVEIEIGVDVGGDQRVGGVGGHASAPAAGEDGCGIRNTPRASSFPCSHSGRDRSPGPGVRRWW